MMLDSAVIEDQEKDKPWYKQFWPWFIFALPGSVVIAGITTVIIAVQDSDSLVHDDYYKQGLAINQQLDKKQKAIELDIHANMLYQNNNQLTIKINNNPEADQELLVYLAHPSDKQQDQSIIASRVSDNTYSAKLNKPVQGKRKVTIESQQNQWQLQATWHSQTTHNLHISAKQ